MPKGSLIDEETLENPWSSEQQSAVSEASGSNQQQIRSDELSHENRDAPPVYSGPSEPANDTPITQSNYSLPGMPNIDFSKYRIPESTLSKDQSTVTTTLSSLTSDPATLERFIREQASLPPRPHICIKGHHASNVDFDIKINMIRYIMHPEEHWNFVKLSALPEKKLSKSNQAGQDSLGDWTKRFCKDNAIMKT
jgi:hypothetical protein